MLNNYNFKNNRSFTLLETIVVIAVIGLTLPVLFAIIFTLLKQQIKIYRLSQIKREGDYIISVMENTLRDRAVTVHSTSPANDVNIVCKDAGNYPLVGTINNLYFLDKDNHWFGYLSENNTISSKSADLISPSINLTSSKILISNFTIACSKKSIYSPTLVFIGFNICYEAGTGVCTSIRSEENNFMYYQIRIKLRNY